MTDDDFWCCIGVLSTSLTDSRSMRRVMDDIIKDFPEIVDIATLERFHLLLHHLDFIGEAERVACLTGKIGAKRAQVPGGDAGLKWKTLG